MQKIIICDDEMTIRNGLIELISKHYPKLIIAGAASNGYEAMQLILDHHPDVVLMDINMPGLSGLEVMEKTGSQSPLTKFIVLSGYSEFEYAQKAIRLKVFDYLLKPVDRRKLIERVDQALNLCLQEEISAAKSAPEAEKSLGSEAVQYVYRNYKNPDLCLSMIAEILHVSSSYLSRVMRKETGMSFSEFLTKVRMESAIAILSSCPEISALKVSEETGYRNQHYFCKVFRQYTGQTSTEYRNSLSHVDGVKGRR